MAYTPLNKNPGESIRAEDINEMSAQVAQNETHMFSLFDDTEALSSGDNFNDLTTPGSYTVINATMAGTILNIPVASGGRLVVMTAMSDARFYQIYFANNATIYVRYYSASGFTAWRAVSTSAV